LAVRTSQMLECIQRSIMADAAGQFVIVLLRS
jgi:hypothetical protein